MLLNHLWLLKCLPSTPNTKIPCKITTLTKMRKKCATKSIMYHSYSLASKICIKSPKSVYKSKWIMLKSMNSKILTHSCLKYLLYEKNCPIILLSVDLNDAQEMWLFFNYCGYTLGDTLICLSNAICVPWVIRKSIHIFVQFFFSFSYIILFWFKQINTPSVPKYKITLGKWISS